MIPQIKELNFPSYATLSQATVTLNDMGDRTISAQVNIDGGIVPVFSFDWEVEFQGERYIHPVREPQASKGNDSICSVIDLTFQHWTIYQLRRYYFVEMTTTESGTIMADKYIASLKSNLKTFCNAFQRVLDYYYNGEITIDLNPDWGYREEVSYIEISYTHIWDVLQKLYEVYGVRWTIEGTTIKVGYPTEEVSHIFEYGFEGGLLKVERQVQSADIRNSLLGRGGEKNLPYRYFKDEGTDAQGYKWSADPDWIPELANTYFTELRGKTFRDYVKGWKAKHYGGTPMSEPTEAYTKGYTDITFNPIEYVEDKESIEKYGLLQGGLENQDDIYPSIQGIEVEPYGRIDEIVGAEQVVVDESEDNSVNTIEISNIVAKTSLVNRNISTYTYKISNLSISVPNGYVAIAPSNFDVKIEYVFGMDQNPQRIDTLPADVNMKIWVETKLNKASNYFNSGSNTFEYEVSIHRETLDYHSQWYGAYVTITPPRELKLIHGEILSINKTASIQVESGNTNRLSIQSNKFQIKEGDATKLDIPINVTTNDINIGQFTWNKDIRIVNVNTGEVLSSINIPQGDYTCEIVVDISNLSENVATFELTVGDSLILYPIATEEFKPKFDIWVKNIWNTTRNENESDEAYAERVWRPILGDREGNEAKVCFSSGNLSGHSDYEFTIVKGGVAYDNSALLNGVRSEWRLTLAKSTAELEATGLYIPSTKQQVNAGDKFFFTGIDMPHQYVLWAEEKLDNYKKDQLLETAHIKPTWVVQTDKVRLNQIQEGEAKPLLNALKVGNLLRLADTRFTNGVAQNLYLQSVTYSWQADTSMLPNVEVVLSDKVTTSLNPVAQLQGEVDVLTRQVGNISNIQRVVRAVGDKLYLRKDGVQDVSNSPTEFGNLLTSKGYRQGAYGGSGWGLRSEHNKGILEIDTLIVRDEMRVNSLVVNQVSAIGGKEILSAASIECSKVEVLNEGFKCYFDQKRGSVANLFVEHDIAYSQVFNANDIMVKFYKREVIEVGDNYILLSLDSGDDSNGAPQVGDVIAQYGNTTDTTRQYVIIRDVVGGGYERMLSDLNSVSTSGVEYYFAGRLEGNTPRWFVGNANGDFIEWKDGKLKIKGSINIEEGSTGIENLEGLPEIVQEAVTGIEVGGQNLLRNSGFTGDYLSEQLADDSVLDATNEMFNPLNSHWHFVEAEVNDSNESQSGKEVLISGRGSISQTLTSPLIPNETYILSFKAKGDQLTYSVGGVVKTLSLTDKWAKYKETIVIISKSTSFAIQDASCVICEIQLERGTIATAWSNSPFDNSSDRAYYQSLKYLNQALNEGSTDILGGLVLTNHIKVGNYADGDMIKETGGMQGSWSSDNSPFLWGGGTYEQALDTIAKYADNQSYQPTNEELATMAKFVVTHGGRAILNDIILRGYIYALGGVFNGTIYAKGGTFDGRLQMPFVNITNYPSTGRITSINIGNETYERYIVPLLPSYSSHINASILYDQPYILGLPNSLDFDGWVLNVYCAPRISRMEEITGVVAIDTSTNDITSQYYGHIFSSQIMNKDGFAQPLRAIMCPSGGTIQLVCVGGQWQVTNYIHNIQYLV